MGSRQPPQKTTRDQALVGKIKDYIDAHYQEDLKPGTLAEWAKISESKLRAIFSKELRTNFTNYLLDIRLEKAREMLKASDEFIIDIAMKVGFNDPKYFSKLFKKKFGLTPQEFKEKGR